MVKYLKAERVMMRNHPEMSEKWIQHLIAEDPSILGLGDLVLRAQERIHAKAGRLDLLLQDPDTNRRYEVELQLGPTDESHIIVQSAASSMEPNGLLGYVDLPVDGKLKRRRISGSADDDARAVFTVFAIHDYAAW